MTRTQLLAGLASLAVACGAGTSAMADSFADEAVTISRITSGVDSNGWPINTSWDDNDDGTDATGAPNIELGRQGLSLLGFDANDINDPDDDEGGFVTLLFTDNVCADGPNQDIRVYESFGDESAMVEVSNDGQNFVEVGEVGPATSFDIDVNGAMGQFNMVRLKATSHANSRNTAGIDLDAVECLHAAEEEDEIKAQADGCDLVGPEYKRRSWRKRRSYYKSYEDAGIDVEDVVATSDGYALSIQLHLCGELSKKGIYMVHFDYTDRTNLDGDDVDDGPDTLDHNPRCRRTSDRTAIYHRGREKGGTFTVSETVDAEGNTRSTLTLNVDYYDMNKGEGVVPGSKVVFWVETKGRGYVRDHVPTTESGDHCSRPQLAKEVMEITLQ